MSSIESGLDAGGKQLRKKRTRSLSSKSRSNSKIFDSSIEAFLDADQHFQIVCSVRNEIVDNALDICYKNYVQKQSVKFLVHCLNDAWISGLKTAFMYYDKDIVKISNDSVWENEAPPKPCEKDTWAQLSLPIIEQPESEEEKHSIAVETQRSAVMEKSVSLIPSGKGYEEITGEVSADFGEGSSYYDDISSEMSFFTAMAKEPETNLPYLEDSCPPGKEAADQAKTQKASMKKSSSHTGDGFFINNLPPIRQLARFNFRKSKQ